MFTLVGESTVRRYKADVVEEVEPQINELISRLTGEPVRDETQTNKTLDENEATFPIGRDEEYDEVVVDRKKKRKIKGRKMYVDFSHDNLMVAVYAALGLDFGVHGDMHFELDGNKKGLIKRDESKRNRYIASNLVPFASEMVIERMKCAVRGAYYRKREYETFVRILINDDLQPLPFCSGDKYTLDEADEYKNSWQSKYMCTLDDFVFSQAYSRGNGMGDWEKCFDFLE